MAAEPQLQNKEKIVAVLGPTGCGKSLFAVDLACRAGGEIISCDSMAVYKDVFIGTDKLEKSKQKGVPHYLYDVVEAGSYFSAGLFRQLALKATNEISLKGKIPILVGGTGLYAKALLDGLSSAPPRDENLRRRLKSRIDKKGLSRLHKLLKRLDPKRAAEISPNDELRIIRSLEVTLIAGKPFSKVISKEIQGPNSFDALKLCLTLPRPLLYKNIEERVDKMVKDGLVEEARSLWNSGKLSGPIAKAIGYKELVPCFDGKRELGAAIEEIKKNSRNLAKRQLTWFRKEIGIEWIRMDCEVERKSALDSVNKWFKGEKNDG